MQGKYVQVQTFFKIVLVINISSQTELMSNFYINIMSNFYINIIYDN
jgi:hypothetical protein